MKQICVHGHILAAWIHKIRLVSVCYFNKIGISQEKCSLKIIKAVKLTVTKYGFDLGILFVIFT